MESRNLQFWLISWGTVFLRNYPPLEIIPLTMGQCMEQWQNNGMMLRYNGEEAGGFRYPLGIISKKYGRCFFSPPPPYSTKGTPRRRLKFCIRASLDMTTYAPYRNTLHLTYFSTWPPSPHAPTRGTTTVLPSCLPTPNSWGAKNNKMA